MSRFFRRPWDELRGDAFDSWGKSTWLFDVLDDGTVVRQVELYEHGQRLRYHDAHVDDAYGGLSVVSLDLADFERFEIGAADFEAVWSSPPWSNGA